MQTLSQIAASFLANLAGVHSSVIMPLLL